MKKILLISDSHFMNNLNEYYEYENPDYFFHLGDSQLQYSDNELKNCDFKIRGNCDFDNNFPLNIISNLDNIGSIYLTHGHQENLKFSFDSMYEIIKNQNLNLFLYGHTHKLHIEYNLDKDYLIINPGSLQQSRSTFPETYVVLNYSDTIYEVLIKNAKDFQIIEKKIFNR